MSEGFPSQYCKSLTLLGHDTCLLYLSKQIKRIRRLRHSFGHNVIEVPIRGSRHLTSMLTALEIVRTREFWESDVIHTFNYYNPLVFFLTAIAKIMRKKIVVSSHFHPYLSGHKMKTRTMLMIKATLEMARHIVCINSEDMEWLRTEFRINPSKLSMIPNGIDSEFYTPSDKTEARSLLRIDPLKKYVLCVSRLHPAKGQDVLLQAFRKVVNEVRDSVLVVVGTGSFGHELRELCRDLGLGSKVNFTGFVIQETKRRWYQASDVFVLPSLMEMFSLVVLEAMSSELPVVSTKVSGWTQLSQEREIGITVPIADSDSLAAAIIRLLQNQSLRAKLGSAGRRLVLERYTWERMGEKLSDLFRQIAL